MNAAHYGPQNALRWSREAALSKAWRMKHLDEEIDLHLREFMATRPRAPLVIAECSPEFWDWKCSDLGISIPSPLAARSGHPFELDVSESVAYSSLSAALLVDKLMQQYRTRNSTRRVPEKARNAYIRFALEIYPKASLHTIIERIRLRKTGVFVGGLSFLDDGKVEPGN